MQTIIATELKNLLEKEEALLVDVRGLEEHEAEHIEGSILLPLNEISVEKIPTNSKTIVLYCRSGKRSLAAAQKLLEQDPNLEIFSLEGGIIAWRTEELPTITSTQKLSLKRQTHLLVGIILLISFIVGIKYPALNTLAGLVGIEQIIVAMTGWCGGAYLLSKMPWNK